MRKCLIHYSSASKEIILDFQVLLIILEFSCFLFSWFSWFSILTSVSFLQEYLTTLSCQRGRQYHRFGQDYLTTLSYQPGRQYHSFGLFPTTLGQEFHRQTQNISSLQETLRLIHFTNTLGSFLAEQQ